MSKILTKILLKQNRRFQIQSPDWSKTRLGHTIWLPLGVERVDIHREVQLALDHLDSGAGEFVGAVDALCVPVRPVDGVLEQRDGKRVRQT